MVKQIKTHQHRKLTEEEKVVITFLDSSKERNRLATVRTNIEWHEGFSRVKLSHGRVNLFVEPMTIVSLVGKRLVKVRYGILTLDMDSISKRVRASLEKDGFYEDMLAVLMSSIDDVLMEK